MGMTENVEIAVIGGGPAGLCAAVAAAAAGASCCLIDRERSVGGQLIKQTHMFFGSKRQHASTRGIDIAGILSAGAGTAGNIEILKESTVLGLYEDNILTIECGGRYIKKHADAVILATGASEKFLSFPNNDLPGIYGAGAVQTLMNGYGVKPGENALMVGAGNIGLIVSYQLIQAGVRVKAVIDAAPVIGGYMVHASKLRRMGVPIYTGWTVGSAHGHDRLERVIAREIGGDGVMTFDVDMCCIAVGLTPLAELMWQVGCEMRYVPELGGHVPMRDESMRIGIGGAGDAERFRRKIYVAGDAAGVEEASAAMVEGQLAGLCAARALGYATDDFEEQRKVCLEQLEALRSGPSGDKVREGLRRLNGTGHIPVSNTPVSAANGCGIADDLEKTGVPSAPDIERITPPEERRAKGPIAVAECFRRIPCDPCYTSCPRGAIKPWDAGRGQSGKQVSELDINDIPWVDPELCNGCGICVSRCPGLAITVLDESACDADEALVRLPYEFLPLPDEGSIVTGLDRKGNPVCAARVVRVTNTKAQDRTPIVTLAVPREMSMTVRFMEPGNFFGDNTIICRCEEITQSQIRGLIAQGFSTLDEIKRVSRAGMGPCQGRTCRHLISREIESACGVSAEHQKLPVFRPPVKPIRLGAIFDAACEQGDGHE